MALTHAARGGQRLQAVSPAAAVAGLSPGMTLADARAVAPSLRTEPADPAADAEALAVLARWAGRYSPWTALDGGDGLILESTGCDHLFGGETAMLADMAKRFAGAGITVRLALADTPGAAWALARFGDAAAEDGAGIIAPPGGTMVRLASLPVAALRLDAETVEGLRRLGLRRIGELYRLPRESLGRRFGTGVMRRLDRTLGRAGEPISPLLPTPEFRVRADFGEPIGAAGDVARTAGRLIARMAEWLAKERRGARRLDLAAYLADGGVSVLTVGCARAMRDAGHWERLFAEKLAELDPGFGIDAMILAAPRTEPLAAAEPRLDRRAAPGDGLGRLADRLANRLGPGSVAMLRPGNSHLPEHAERRVAPGVRVRAEGWPHTPPRPARLLAEPEPVEAVAGLPDLPPRRFRWRRGTHRVVAAEGPERIAPEWWRDMRSPGREAAATRDYYRVDCADGRRFWLYREGLYGAPAARPPRWFLHGLF